MNTLRTEYGIFTNNEITGQTAQEVYEEWLKNKQIDNCLEEIKTNEQLTIENNQLWETVEFLLKNVDMIPKESL